MREREGVAKHYTLFQIQAMSKNGKALKNGYETGHFDVHEWLGAQRFVAWNTCWKNKIEAPGQSMPGEESIPGHARSVPEVSNPFVCN